MKYQAAGTEADETIRDSLHKLNIDFPVVESPVKLGLETPAAGAHDSSADVSSELPVFDRTPMVCPDATTDGSVVAGQRTAGPVFDSTPVQRDNFEPDVTNSSSIGPTPVLEETQSQSVDGTEQVTQEHNVQKQLDYYAQVQANKIAEHQDRLKLHYVRKNLKMQSAMSRQPVSLDGLSQSSPGSPSRPKKPRVDVIKKKILPNEFRRHSPRFLAKKDTDISDESASPVKPPSAKRKIVIDKPYVPDAADEAALEHDDGDFQGHVHENKTKKRRVGAVSSGGPSTKKQCLEKGGVVPKKKPGPKKKADAGKGTDKERFQQTVRCSIGEVRAAAKLLKEPHIIKVKEAGFGCVFEWVLEGNVSRVLMCHLMMTIDTSTMNIHCGSGKHLVVNRESVHQVLGFPMGGYAPPFPSDSGHDESLRSFKRELGVDSKAGIESKDLRKLLENLVEDPEKVDLAVKVFFAILYNKLVCPGSTPRVGREAAMLVDMDYKKMSEMDFCQLVVDEIKRAAMKYQDRTIPQAGPEGCGLVPTVMYLDSCMSVKYSIMHTQTPRADYLHEKPLEKIYKLDLFKHGGVELSNYKFGKLGWKGLHEVAYSYPVPIQDCRTIPLPRSPSRVPGVEHKANTEIVHSQEPLNTALKHQSSVGNEESSNVSVINQIGKLLNEAAQLSHNIPSTSDRLSRIFGLFPEGHGPSAEAVKEETKHEKNLLYNLRLALSCMQSGFAEFGKKQDALCREFEREAVTIQRQISMQDAAEGSRRQIGLGQSAGEADV